MRQPSTKVTTSLGVAAVVLALLGVVAAGYKDHDDEAHLAATGPSRGAVVDTTEPTVADGDAAAEAPATTPTVTEAIDPPAGGGSVDDAEFEAFLDWLPDGMLASLDLGRALLQAAGVESDPEMAAICAEVEDLLPGTRAVFEDNPVAAVRDPYLQALDHLAVAVDSCQRSIASQDWDLMMETVEAFEAAGLLIDESNAAMEAYFTSHGLDPATFE